MCVSGCLFVCLFVCVSVRYNLNAYISETNQDKTMKLGRYIGSMIRLIVLKCHCTSMIELCACEARNGSKGSIKTRFVLKFVREHKAQNACELYEQDASVKREARRSDATK